MALYWRRQIGNQPIYAAQGTLELVGEGRKPVRKTFKQEVAKGQYDFRVKRTTADSTTDRLTNDTSLLGVKFFQQMPADVGGQTRVGMLLQATGQLNGPVDRYSAMASAATVVPGLGSTPINTSNPAAWFLRIAKGVYHPTTGALLAGLGLSDSDIDYTALTAWAQFCETNSLMCNALFREKISCAEALAKICRVGRGSYTFQSGKLGVIWDIPNQSPVALFGPHNMIPGSFSISYNSEKLADEIVVRFENEEKNYESETIRVAVPGASTSNQNPAEVDLWGVTNKVQAGKEANLLAAEQVWRRRRISWETDLEGSIVTRGDVVLLSHDLTAWGATGRVYAAASTTSITLDKPVTGTGAQQWLAFRRPDNETITYHRVSIFTGEASTITLTDALPLVPGADGDHVPADYVWLFDASSTPGKKAKIVAITPADENRIQITAVDENPEYYASEGDPYTYQPSAPVVGILPNIQNLRVAAANDPDSQSDQLYAYVSWEIAGANFTEAHVYAKVGTGAFEFKGSTKTNYLSFPADPSATYTIKVIVYGELGTLGGGNSLITTWTPTAAAPAQVADLASDTGSTVTSGQDMRISWGASPLATHYKLTLKNGATTIKTVTIEDVAFVYTAEDARLDGGPWRSITFEVQAGNQFGYSTAQSITLTNPAPAALTGLSLQAALDIAILTFTPPTDGDFAGILVWMSTTSGFTPGPSNLKYDGTDNAITLRLADLTTTHYVRVAAYDTFGKDVAELNLSSELSVVGQGVDHAQLASSFNNELANYDAQYSIKTSNGAVAGYGLSSSPPTADGQTTAFIVQADKFGIVKPASGGATITTISRTSNVVTANTQAAHNLAVGTSVIVSGVTDNGFNGTFVVTEVPTSTQIRWAQTAANASSSGGSLKAVPLVPFIFDTTTNPPRLSIDGYLSASRVLAGTFSAINNIGSTKVFIDGPNERITVNDGTRDRVQFGKLASGNYGIKIVDVSGNTVLVTDGSTTQLNGNLLVNGSVQASALSVTNLAAISATLGTVTAGNIGASTFYGGSYTSSFTWPNPNSGGFHLSATGLLLGNYDGSGVTDGSHGRYIYMLANSGYAEFNNIYIYGNAVVRGDVEASSLKASTVMVQTAHVAGEAITVPRSGYTDAVASTNNVEATAATCSFPTGATSVVLLSFVRVQAFAGSNPSVTVQLKRGSTVLMSKVLALAASQEEDVLFCFAETPGSSDSYTLTVKTDSAITYTYYSKRFISAFGTKGK